MIKKNDPVLIRAEGLSLQSGMSFILKDVSVFLKKGESMAITGPSGSGKTSIGKILAGRIVPTHGELLVAAGLTRLMVDQQDHFITRSRQRSIYYGQRYENPDLEDTPDVLTYLREIHEKTVNFSENNGVREVMEQMQITHLSKSKLLQLSNGERKRIQLAAALLQKPGLLVLDQPFVGLDAGSRMNLTGLLEQQMQAGIAIVLISDPEHIPAGIQKVLELHRGRVSQFVDRSSWQPRIIENEWKNEEPDGHLFDMLKFPSETYSDIVRMKRVNVTIRERKILKDIDWRVRSGEQWALLGHNGAGKTTLLSLITADNPQGYTNDLLLFDRQRGSGESIWDIKNRIGFVSPELHLYFLKGEGIFNTIPGLGETLHTSYSTLSCTDVIVSGFRDETGFSSPPTDRQREIANAWLSALQLEYLNKRLFNQASLGEQRSLLLARALVKSPTLLILDEPCQGLDQYQKNHFLQLLDRVCTNLHITLIYVTHLWNEIPACVDNLLLLENGQVKYCGILERENFVSNKK